MLNQDALKRAVDTYDRNTRKAIEAARNLTLPEPASIRFRTKDLTADRIGEALAKVPTVRWSEKQKKTRGFLYLFLVDEDCRVSRADVLRAFEAEKTSRKGGLGKMNLCAANTEALVGRVLYVGRSWDPATRVGTHLRADLTSGTYAIHFAAWAGELDLAIELLVYEFSAISDRALQVIEDGLWDDCRPLFGRRGEK